MSNRTVFRRHKEPRKYDAVIWGHIESIMNRRNNPLSLVVATCEPLGTCPVECVVGENIRIAKGVERLRLEEIRPGEFVVATFREHAGWLEAERIDGIVFKPDSAIGLREETRPSPSTTGGIPWR